MKHISILACWLQSLGRRIADLLRGIVDALRGGFRDGPGHRPWFGASGVPKLPRPPRRGASAANPMPVRETEPLDLVGTRR